MTDTAKTATPDVTHDNAPHVHGPDCNHDHDHAHGNGHHHPSPIEQYVRAEPKIGRNESCPCGSGKKYKKCCLNG